MTDIVRSAVLGAVSTAALLAIPALPAAAATQAPAQPILTCRVKTPEGLSYTVIKAGKGEKPGPDSKVEVNYSGRLAADGSEFDSGEGAKLVDAKGRAFMADYHVLGDLAPRDEVARAIHSERAAGRGAFLDCTKAIGAHFPEQKLTFINRGISGNSVTDLAARWRKDTLGEKPDILSVLIGINDVGKAFRVAKRVDGEALEIVYEQILTDARAANPKLKIVLCEPFVTPGSATQARFADWKEDVEKLQAVVGRLAVKFNAPVVRLQKVFDDAAKRADMTYWVWDGVHPTYAGHQLLSEAWLKCVREAWPQK